jgi:hypothetical protein
MIRFDILTQKRYESDLIRPEIENQRKRYLIDPKKRRQNPILDKEKREREREKRERERVWCCRSYIYSVHRWIVLISDYVVPSNLLSTLTERICYPINEVRDIDLVIFLLFCIFSSGTMEKW